VEKRRIVTETVSGSSAIEQRPGFVSLLNKLEQDDVLVVTKLDRLGRNAMDVQATVKRLAGMGVRVHCLALGGVDLASPAGKVTVGVRRENAGQFATRRSGRQNVGPQARPDRGAA
jgi:putative DNA-invertase from lambdoid prophage Rac